MIAKKRIAKKQRTILTHSRFGREQSLCGRGASNPQFLTLNRAEVTCPRCKKQLEAFDLVKPDEGWDK